VIYFDERWIGSHGIGRFAKEVFERLNPQVLKMSGNPASPFDSLKFTARLFSTNSNGTIISPGFNFPLLFLGRFVFCIHDLNHIDRSENSSFFKKIYYYFLLKYACRKCYKILTVSEFSRKKIILWAGVDEAKVVNVGNGVSSSFHADVKPYKIDQKYFLVVGNRKKHKNELRVLDAFSLLDDDKVYLIFTGRTSPELTEKINSLKINKRVLFKADMTDGDLASLYKGAEALVFPSLYEGFGLPVVEAMSCGTAVITANTTSLPEVSGDSAILVDPESVHEIFLAMHSILADEKIKETLIESGYNQAKLFSWDLVVSKIIKAIVV